MSFQGLAVRLCCLFVLCCLPGCGGNYGGRTSISGTVKFDGKPVEKGSIAFIPAEGVKGPSTGGLIQDGKYNIAADQGPMVGKHRVEIIATRATAAVEVKAASAATAGPSAGGKVAGVESYIPEQFNKKSTLSYVVKAGQNVENFDLKSK